MRELKPCGCRLSLKALSGGRSRLFGNIGQKRRDRPIGENDVPVPVDGKGGEGHMPVHHGFDGLPGRRHIGRLHRSLGMDRCITRRQHQPVGGAGGHRKLLRQFREHVAAGG